MTWPTAELDRIQRLRVLAAGLPGSVVREYRVEVPFDRAWGWLGDLEHSTPQFDVDVSRLRVVQRSADGTRLRIRANGPGWTRPLWLPFDVDLSEGWCWMVARPQIYVVGMAAEPDGAGTRLAHLEGVPLPTPRVLRPLVRPLLSASRRRHAHHVASDVRHITALIEGA